MQEKGGLREARNYPDISNYSFDDIFTLCILCRFNNDVNSNSNYFRNDLNNSDNHSSLKHIYVHLPFYHVSNHYCYGNNFYGELVG